MAAAALHSIDVCRLMRRRRRLKGYLVSCLCAHVLEAKPVYALVGDALVRRVKGWMSEREGWRRGS